MPMRLPCLVRLKDGSLCNPHDLLDVDPPDYLFFIHPRTAHSVKLRPLSQPEDLSTGGVG